MDNTDMAHEKYRYDTNHNVANVPGSLGYVKTDERLDNLRVLTVTYPVGASSATSYNKRPIHITRADSTTAASAI